MLKHCLVWLLILFMSAMPALSCAEMESATPGASLTISYDTDDQALRSFLLDLLEPSFTEAQTESLSKGLSNLLRALRVEFSVQPDAMQTNAFMEDDCVLSMTAWEAGKYLYLLGSLVQKYVVEVPLYGGSVSIDQQQDLQEAIAQFPWRKMRDDCLDIIQQWMNGQHWSMATGSFRGDAYRNGAYCKTAEFDHRDMSLLAVALIEKIRPVSGLLAELGLDSERMIHELMQYAISFGLKNELQYQLSIIYDQSQQFQGASLTAYRDIDAKAAQVMTLSIGKTADGYRAVAGWGMQQAVYYTDIQVASEKPDINSPDQMKWSLAIREYVDSERRSFALIENENSLCTGTLNSTVTVQPARTGLEWHGETALSAGRLHLIFQEEGRYASAPFSALVQGTLRADKDANPLMQYSVTGRMGPAIQIQADGMEHISLETCESEDLQRLTDVLSAGMQKTFFKVMEHIPSELLSFFLTIHNQAMPTHD